MKTIRRILVGMAVVLVAFAVGAFIVSRLDMSILWTYWSGFWIGWVAYVIYYVITTDKK